jgi:hypothetical protein
MALLSEIAPGLKRAAIMFNPDTAPASAFMPTFETEARSLKVKPITAPVHDDVEIETAIIALGREPRGGLVVMPDVFTSAHRVPIISAAVRNKVPAVYASFYWAREGGLLSYGPDLVNAWRRAASYVDRILRGEKPGDLPVQFLTKFKMIVNRKTATAPCHTPIDTAARRRGDRITLRRDIWGRQPSPPEPLAKQARSPKKKARKGRAKSSREEMLPTHHTCVRWPTRERERAKSQSPRPGAGVG